MYYVYSSVSLGRTRGSAPLCPTTPGPPPGWARWLQILGQLDRGHVSEPGVLSAWVSWCSDVQGGPFRPCVEPGPGGCCCSRAARWDMRVAWRSRTCYPWPVALRASIPQARVKAAGLPQSSLRSPSASFLRVLLSASGKPSDPGVEALMRPLAGTGRACRLWVPPQLGNLAVTSGGYEPLRLNLLIWTRRITMFCCRRLRGAGTEVGSVLSAAPSTS